MTTDRRPLLAAHHLVWIAPSSPAWAAVASPPARHVAALPADQPRQVAPAPHQVHQPVPRQLAPDLAQLVERARPLLPIGRGLLAQKLGITEHWARKALEALDTEPPRLAAVREA